VIGIYEMTKVSGQNIYKHASYLFGSPPKMDIKTSMFLGRPCMLIFCLFSLYVHVTVCSQCLTGLSIPLVGTTTEVALFRNTAQFEARVNRISAPRDFSGTAPFQPTGGPGPVGKKTSAVVFNLDTHLLNAGSHEMKIGTNGFTAVAVFKFTGIVSSSLESFSGNESLNFHQLQMLGIVYKSYDKAPILRLGL